MDDIQFDTTPIDDNLPAVTTPRYTDNQRNNFVAVAVDIGVAAAIEELGYPKMKSTGMKWVESAGLLDQIPTLGLAATTQGLAYGQAEQHHILSVSLDGIYQSLLDDTLEPRDRASLARAINETVQTMRLIRDEATSIVASVDQADSELRAAILDLQAEQDAEYQEIIDAEVVVDLPIRPASS